MFSTKQVVVDIKDIPDEWIYSFYLQLDRPLSGRAIYLKSPFSDTDTRPSFCLYYREGKYKFKDFSHGSQGSAVDFVMTKFNLTYGKAVKKIIQDYVDNPDFKVEVVEKKEEFNIKCTHFECRDWNLADVDFWKSYKIGSSMLKRYNVRALDSLKVEMYGDEFIYNSELMYGYFNKEGELCKVYRPFEKMMRFIRLKEYVQGSDQLIQSTKIILIQASLKDIMAMQTLGLRVNGLAPEGESTLLDIDFVNELKDKGYKLFTLFDPDQAGIKGMLKYKEEYGIPYIYIPKPDEKTKDIADIRKNYSRSASLRLIVPKINSALCQIEI